MANGAINWRQQDYLALGKAVSNFNKKVRELEAKEVDVKVPKEVSYKELKQNTLTRGQLNQVLNSLRRFTRDDAQNVFTTEAGENITLWEHRENVINKRRATRFIKSQIRELEKPIDKGDYSKAEMGAEELRKWVADLHSITKLEKEKGYNYERLKLRVDTLGRHDYTYAKSIIFRENFEYALNHLDGLEGYDLLMKKLNRYKNPINFYNLIKQSNVFMDIFTYYDNSSGIVYGGFSNEQARFNRGLQDLGIVDEEKARAIKRAERKENEELIAKARSINNAEDLFEYLDFEKSIKRKRK